ncbi:hypothetical protein AKJ41_05435 [candidate division MSBL1 archaeon SCGC-AAA259O05]|uniref:Uncharacterized protein n=1 Tax=candidate division MSBL1 archaeon SCGC-AAA259O05 TaxID=1698271 RepID=A0A133UZ39_9EURY|nr:hypothetical protein AKJ41_05435 [candidate division MSBL1 archaeon SCGC-AAA259O05]
MEEFLTFLSLLALSIVVSTSTGMAPLLVLGGVSFAWLVVGNWLVHGISPFELPLKEAFANFRNRIQGLTASERTGREIAQGIADRIAENCGVPPPSVEMEDFKTSLTGRRGKFQPPDKIAIDGLFLGFVALSEEKIWETLLAGTVAREFQKYLSFLGGAKAPVTAGMEEAELEETGWSEEKLREVEEELASSLEKVERRGSALEFGG